MVLGLSAEWDVRSVSIFGKQGSVARLAHCSLLIVHANSLAPVVKRKPPVQVTPDSAEHVAAV